MVTTHKALRDTVRITDRCTACGNCIVTCPTHALLRAPKKPLVVDLRCTGCSECIEVCPVGAIVETTAPNELPEKVTS